MTRVFLSYRREDAAADATAVALALSAEFGRDVVFKDVDDVPLGMNWKLVVTNSIAKSAAPLLIIGPDWQLTPPIELEIREALERGILTIPVLIGEARIQRFAEQLPDDLVEVAHLQAAHLDHTSWNRDMVPLVEAVREVIKQDTPSGSQGVAQDVSHLQSEEAEPPPAEQAGFRGEVRIILPLTAAAPDADLVAFYERTHEAWMAGYGIGCGIQPDTVEQDLSEFVAISLKEDLATYVSRGWVLRPYESGEFLVSVDLTEPWFMTNRAIYFFADASAQQVQIVDLSKVKTYRFRYSGLNKTRSEFEFDDGSTLRTGRLRTSPGQGCVDYLLGMRTEGDGV